MKYRNPRHCPFVEKPFDDCFLKEMDSQNIEKAVYYCANRFKECGIYQERAVTMGKELTGNGAPD